MAQEDVRLSGTFLDSTGQALVGKTVTLFAEGTTTPALATDTTNSDGEWAFNDGGSSNGLTPDQIYEVPGRYDVQLVTGAETIRILGRDKFQVTELQSRNPTSLTQPAGIFTNTYTNGGAASAGLTAIYSFRPSTESTGVESAVAGVNGSSVYNDFQLTNSASTPQDFIAGRMAFEAVDVADGSEDSKLNFWTMKAGTLTEVLHLDGTSLHPETTDVVSLGTSALNFSDLFLDSGAVVNFDSGNLTLTHSAGLLTVSGGLTVTGTTTLNGALVLGDAAADTLTVNATIQGGTPLVFEGASAGDFETSFAIANPSADRTITFPDATLTVNAAANISGTTLASNVVTSSLTTVGVLANGSIDTGFGTINNNAAITGTTVTGSTALVGGTVAGTTAAFSGLISANGGITFAAGDDIAFTGGTGTNDIVLTNGLADALSITDGSADVIAISTAGATNTVAITGDLTVSGTQTVVNTVTMNAANAVVFEGATADEHETTLTIENPTADRTVVIPNVSGTLAVLAADSDVAITSTPAELNLLDGVSGLVQADFTKLAALEATAAEIELLDGSAKSTASITVEDADAFIVIDGTTTKQIPASDIKTYVGGSDTTYTAGVGLALSGTTLSLDLSELSTVTPADGDFFSTLDSDGANEQKTTTTALATLFAGTSLTASSSVISVDDDFLKNDASDTTTGTITAAGFTVGSMVLTDGVVTDTSGLSVVAATTVTGALTVGVDDTGHDVKFFGASAGAYMEYDQSADQLRIMGASADAVTSTGKLLLATSLTDINANDVIGKIDFQAPHEAGGTDAITVAASIQAIAQGTFSASVNATDLIFYTGHSEAATEKFRVTSQGELGIGGANYGTDGQVFTSAGAGAAPAWEDAAAGGGITRSSTWRKNASSTGATSYDPVTSWEEADTDGYGGISGVVTESSGTFTFIETGTYLVILMIECHAITNADPDWNAQIKTTTDNSTYDKALRVRGHFEGDEALSLSGFFQFNVSSTTTHKLRVRVEGMSTSSYINSDTNSNITALQLIRLGDST